MYRGAAAMRLDLTSLRQAMMAAELRAAAVVDEVLRRITAAGGDNVWISRVPEGVLRARAAALDALAAQDGASLRRLPLFGIPFAVKDNIDVAGMETTAGCRAFAYPAAISAPVVARLEEAGAILIGKTNMDQFATGLVGTRSPYGVPRNPFDPRFIPGGSSSGSAVAVASGLVSFALGTDTAGSGRVPAAFNNIVGLKPTRGRISSRGVVPACRSLDCVSIFALSCADAGQILDICGTYDAQDPFSRRAPDGSDHLWDSFRFAVPRVGDREFFGDREAPRLFNAAAGALEALGGIPGEADLAPFRAAGEMLYGGPWLAERLIATKELLRREPDALLPLTRQVLAGGERFSAAEAYEAGYRLAALRRESEGLWEQADILLLPTAATIHTVSEVVKEPFALNVRLGLYTNFVNLLDLAAIAVPTGFRTDRLPFGVSLIAPAFSDGALAALGARLQHELKLPLGATGQLLAL